MTPKIFQLVWVLDHPDNLGAIQDLHDVQVVRVLDHLDNLGAIPDPQDVQAV